MPNQVYGVAGISMPDVVKMGNRRRQSLFQYRQQAYFLLKICDHIVTHRKTEDQFVVNFQHKAIPAPGDWMHSLNGYLWKIALDEVYSFINFYHGLLQPF